MHVDPSERRKEIRSALRPTLIAEPLLSMLRDDKEGRRRYHIIVDLNTRFPGGVEDARKRVLEVIDGIDSDPRVLERNLTGARHPFVFAELTRDQIYDLLSREFELAEDDRAKRGGKASDQREGLHRQYRAIFKIWESAQVHPLTSISIRTVKADAAQTAFAAQGEGIVWAVLDSGIDESHPHFARHGNLVLTRPLEHKTFVPSANGSAPWPNPLKDEFGHGTHVGGIIAGASGDGADPHAAQQSVDETGRPTEYHCHPIGPIRGMAPKCKLLSLRVLNELGSGDVTAVINALEWIIQLNGDGSKPLVHGVNLSAGYLPDPQNYGSGQSPICRQVNRAVRSGVVVVVAAGNYGYSQYSSMQDAGAQLIWNAGEFASIADPANADLCIAVGSTHREEPHRYGISYFSSKGPTCDGRLKPDVVAPGERIISCATGTAKQIVLAQMQILPGSEAAKVVTSASAPEAAPAAEIPTAAALSPGTQSQSIAVTSLSFDYLEDTGTSMAAPHVSGVLAAFLSIRREYIGEAENVARLVVSSAMDLKRDARLQGAGLIDLFRMLQSI
jgi:serine protease AprX